MLDVLLITFLAGGLFVVRGGRTCGCVLFGGGVLYESVTLAVAVSLSSLLSILEGVTDCYHPLTYVGRPLWCVPSQVPEHAACPQELWANLVFMCRMSACIMKGL